MVSATTVPLRLRLLRAALAPTVLSLFDQGLVSGFGFLSGIVAARMVDLSSFGRFALVMIFTGFAQGVHNALVVSPMMTLIGSRRRNSAAYDASVLVAATLLSLAAGLVVAALLAGFFGLRGGVPSPAFLAATAVLTVVQNVSFTLRRLLFATGRGLQAVAMDGARVLAFPLLLLGLHTGGVAIGDDTLVGALAASALLTGLPFLAPFRPTRSRLVRLRAVLARHSPLARWLLPVVLVTFGQEQLVYILAGGLLGDGAIGGLRAAQYVVGLVLLIITATENIVPVGAARAFSEGGRPGLDRYLLSTGLRLGVLLAVPLLAVAIPAEFWLRTIFGPSFVPFAGCLRLLAGAALLIHVRDMAAQLFRATQRTGVIFQAFGASLVVSVLCFYPLLAGAGLTGAALVVLIGHIASMSYLLLAALRDRRGEVSQPIRRRLLAGESAQRP
jgi:O-antigen/teichoic acid export membrane protein